MIGDIKSMISGCINHMSGGDCGACERRDACADLFANLFGRRDGARFGRRPERREARPAASGANPFLSFLGEVARTIEARVAEARPRPRGSAFSKQVEALIEPLLESGPVRIDAVARELGLSRQTLYRRLKDEGVTFEAVLDRVRRRLAIRYVREQGMAVKEAAWRLGFSDPAAFSRAFKRWTGSSPGAKRGN